MKKYFLSFFISVFFISCNTYIIPVYSFKDQFGHINYDLSYSKSISGSIHYNGYQIKKINVIDKNGNLKGLDNSPDLEMRITLKNGKRKHFYFDSMKLENDTLTGHKARFLPNAIVKVAFVDIVKIEIQESGKRIKYMN